MGLWRVLRKMPAGLLPLALGAVVLLLPLLGLDFLMARHIQFVCLLALIISGLNLSLGYAGQLAFGQVAVYAAGAYTAGIMAAHGHTDILLQLVAGGLVALVVGLVTGSPGLRLGGWALAMTSFFLVLLVPDLVVIAGPETGGRNGLAGIPTPSILGRPIQLDEIYYLVVAVTIVWFVVLRNIVTSRHGVAFQVLKQSPVLASSMGIPVHRMKLVGYSLGAVPAGLAGVLFANVDGFISPDTFSFHLATTVLAGAVLGGLTSIYGAVIGAALIEFGPNQATDLQEYALIVFGLLLIAGGVVLNGGLMSLARRLGDRLDRASGIDRYVPTTDPDPDAAARIDGQVLRVDDVAKAFGGNQALRGVSFAAQPGQVTALIGPNGSGKTTLLNMISGFYRTDSGTITADGHRLHRRAPHTVARHGVARTFQTPNVPRGVTVIDVVASGRYGHDRVSIMEAALRLPRYRRVRREDVAAAELALARLGILDLANSEAASLPLGTRRLLEVAKALVAAPRILLLDEVASGLDEDEVVRLAQLVREIRAAGTTVLLVEHNFRLVLELSDRVVVLGQGQLVAEGTPEEIEHNPRVVREYLGGNEGSDLGPALAGATEDHQ